MSKAMRIVDREVIERQVIKAWEKQSEQGIIEKLAETKFGEELDADLADYNALVSEIDELEKRRDTLKSQIADDVKAFNEANCELEESHYREYYYGTYLKTDIGSYGNSKAKGFTLETNIPSELRTNIADELALTTMGGDFNGAELVKTLIAKFVG